MAITYQAHNVWSAGFGGGNVTLGNFNVGTGENRCLCVCYIVRTSSTGGWGDNVRYAGAAMTQIMAKIVSNRWLLSIFRLVNPTSGNNALTFGYIGSPERIVTYALALNGVNQTNPVASSGNSNETALNNATFPSASPITLSGGSYGVQFAGVAYSNDLQGPPNNPTPYTTNQASNINDNIGTGLAQYVSSMGRGAASGANLLWDANQSAAFDYVAGGVAFQESMSALRAGSLGPLGVGR